MTAGPNWNLGVFDGRSSNWTPITVLAAVYLEDRWTWVLDWNVEPAMPYRTPRSPRSLRLCSGLPCRPPELADRLVCEKASVAPVFTAPTGGRSALAGPPAAGAVQVRQADPVIAVSLARTAALGRLGVSGSSHWTKGNARQRREVVGRVGRADERGDHRRRVADHAWRRWR